ncbi:MAG: hypothetical protein N3G20_07030, partial [Verrucomicrobiae bacterium]|nr:hypothetical protein [Verrucomicrobiae bacterium]
MNLAPSLAVGLFIAVWPVVAATQRHTGPVGILSALPEEMQLLARCLKNTQTKSFLSVEFRVGTVDGHKVVLATTGIGKVNAAKTTSLLLDRFK